MSEFVDLMEKVEGSGAFSVGGTLPSIPPGLNVKGVGHISLPVLEYQAKELIKRSQQAPFGRGEETVFDTSVRHTWQISPEDFEFTNPQWEVSLQEAINQMGKDLGLFECQIEFEPYKLLVYETGSFFAPHRDTEKTTNMFATLVINLPSEHEGGELIVSHGGQSQRYSFADGDSFHPRFVTFYADCYHEVKPITAGYRICVIYNLSIANRETRPLLTQQAEVADDISNFIRQWVSQDGQNPILAYLLEYSYSAQNLSLANLKQGDFAKASVLLNAAEKNDCRAFLCLVTYYRTSYGETPYYGRYSYNDDWDEEDFEEYDVDTEEVYAHALITAQGEQVGIKKLQLEEEQILANIPLREGPGYGYSISEATGNEGATKDLWYHRGAVILWSKEREFDLLPQVDLDYQIQFLKKSLQDRTALEGGQRPKIIRLADHIIENQYGYRLEELANELVLIGDMALLKKYLHKWLNTYTLSQVNSKAFLHIVERFGWQPFAEDVGTHLTPRREALQWLHDLLLTHKPLASDGQSAMTKWVTDLWEPSLAYRLTNIDIANLLKVVSVLKMDALTGEIIAFLARQTGKDFLTATYGPAVVNSLTALQGHDYERAIMDKFIEDVRQRLEAAFPAPPIEPTNWSREGQLACRCEFCTAVNQFLPDPERSEISFYKTLKRDMVHVENEIEKSGVDLDMEIGRMPPKFKGTCRKNQNKYDNERKLFDTAQKIVHDLQY